MRQKWSLALLILASLAPAFLTGCNSLGDAREARGDGTRRTYSATVDQVWRAVPRAANDLDLSVAGTFQDEGYMLLSRGATMFSWGERVAVFVDPIDGGSSVEVVSKRAISVNITARNFEDSLLDKIGEYLVR